MSDGLMLKALFEFAVFPLRCNVAVSPLSVTAMCVHWLISIRSVSTICCAPDFLTANRNVSSPLLGVRNKHWSLPLPKSKLSLMKNYMKTDLVKDAPGNFVKWSAENDEVYGYVFTEGWYDIGDKNSLEKADIEYRQKELE